MVHHKLPVLIFSILLPLAARADILFEGYSKVLSGEDHIGYVVSRYEFDTKKKNFISTYFLKTGKGATEITESLKAVASDGLTPISYEYTNMVGKDIHIIDAKFKGDRLTAVVKNNGRVRRIDSKIPKGTFLSTFLIYVMLKSTSGLKSEMPYEYQAVAEEDGTLSKGQALVGKEETFNGFRVFKTLNTFKDSKFLSYVNERGEVLGTNALGQEISTELVATPAEAIANQAFSPSIMKTLFGDVPAGEANVKARAAKLKERERSAKEQGYVAPGQGVIIKSAPETEAPNTSKGKNR